MDSKNQDDDKKILVVDRIIENILVCQELDTEVMFEFNLDDYSEKFSVGDVLIYELENLTIDFDLTDKRKNKIQSLFDALFKDDDFSV